jgi:hypothetical protein
METPDQGDDTWPVARGKIKAARPRTEVVSDVANGLRADYNECAITVGEVSDMRVWFRRKIAITAVCALAACATSLVASPVFADSLHVTGHAGFIGEWELTANLADSGPNGQREFSGPLSLKHVGLCTHDGPEEKTGQLRLKLSASSSRLTATLLLQGVECAYSATQSQGYDGVLSCPGQSPVPLVLQLK